MKDLIILGTGIHGGEMAEIIERINSVQSAWRLIGYIAPDNEADRTGEIFNGYPILGTYDILASYPGAFLIPDYEWPQKRDIPPDRLASIVDPSCFVSRTAQLGSGVVIFPNCYIGMNARLGNFVFCLSSSVVNHDDILEDFVTLTSGVRLAGSVYIEEGCYLGQACTVRQKLRIGKGSLLGTGCVVVADVPPNSVMVGNPARKLRNNC